MVLDGETVPILSGVPQGIVLDPLEFLLYIKGITKVRLYLGCFGWVINLIYSTLFSNILHTFSHNITYAQNLGSSNRYALFTCSDLTSAIVLSCEDA